MLKYYAIRAGCWPGLQPAAAGIPVIPYRVINDDGGKRVVPALSKYPQWLCKPQDELGEEFWHWLLNEWKQARENTG